MSENSLQSDLVYALACTAACDGQASSRIYFAARGSGLYRSDDDGQSWVSIYASLDVTGPLPTTSVVLTPNCAGVEPGPKTGQGMAGYEIFAGVPGGVLHSADEGESWVAAVLDTPPPSVSALAISPNFVEDGVLLAASTEDGIFRSASRGSHWARWNFGLLDLSVFCLAISPGFAQDETLFAGVETGVFRSTNGGRAWREIDLSVGYEPVVSLALSPHYPQDGSIWVGTEAQGLLFSSDDGVSWSRLGQAEITDPVNSILVSQAYPEQADILVLSENALWLSRDGGSGWDKVQPVMEGMTAVLAPQGLHRGALLLIGLMDGNVIPITLEL
jgi:photosystem II stability/assembly factor-like uncharacterized protein